MKKVLSALIILIIPVSLFSQKLDLIVTNEGDSIACKIINISDSYIVYEVKRQNTWIPTNILRENISDYEEAVIDEELFVFRPGTSYIKGLRNSGLPQTMFDIRKNAFINESILFNTYERIFPVRDNFGILGKVGIMIFDPFFPFIEASGIYFGPTHFIETGVGLIYIDNWSPTFRAGYRFQSFKGLLFKASIITAPFEEEWVPLIGIGYAFGR